MQTNQSIKRVRIYINERDIFEGLPLYLAVLNRLKEEAATGATVLRGVEGFGPGHRQRSGFDGPSQSVPIVIEWIDRGDRVERILPALDELLPNALITVEMLEVYRAVMRSSGLFGDRTIGDVMERDVSTVGWGAGLHEAVRLLVERSQDVLPVLDEQQRVVGVLSARNMLQRGLLPLAPRLLARLSLTDRSMLLDPLAAQQLSEFINVEPRTLHVESPIPQAINTLIEWDLDALPVLDRDGRWSGLFGIEQALRAALEGRRVEGPVRDAEQPTPVRLVMQQAVPAVAARESALKALAQLLAHPDRFLVVVDAGGPVGIVDAAQVANRLGNEARSAWLRLLQETNAPFPASLEATLASQTAASFVDGSAPTINAFSTQDDAIRLMLQQGHERLVVVDEQGQLVGLVARRGLLRALAQTS